MSRFMTSVVLLASVCMVTACGGSDEGESQPKTQPGQVNEESAKAAARQAIQASLTAIKQNDGENSAFQFQGAASQSQGVISPAPAAGTGMPGAAGALAAGTCNCSETSCTFQDCGEEGSSTINGTISWDGGHVKCDLTFKVKGTTSFNELDLSTKCDLTVTETSIDGTLKSAGKISNLSTGGGEGEGASIDIGNYEWDTNTKYEGVTYDTSGQPTGGTIHVDGTYSIMGQTYSGSAHITLP